MDYQSAKLIADAIKSLDQTFLALGAMFFILLLVSVIIRKD